MGSLFGGGGDDSAVQQQMALEQKQYDENNYKIALDRANLNNNLMTLEHAQTGPFFSTPDTGETVNPIPD